MRKIHATELQALVCRYAKVLALILAPMALWISPTYADDRPEWVLQIKGYPVGQTDPFEDELDRLQVLKLSTGEREEIQRRYPDWQVDAGLLADFFPHCYQPLQLTFDPHEFEERGLLKFAKTFTPHEVNPHMLFSSSRSYSVHVDRYADPRWEGKYSGAILLVPGTGSYGGNYIKFCQVLASLKGYIVYVVDLLYHGRSHGQTLVARDPEGEGVAVYLKHAIGKDGAWHFTEALESGWEERESCQVNMTRNVTVIQAVGRRIAQAERENLKHLDAEVLSKPPEIRAEEWYGKPVSSLTHVTLIGTSQGGETAFWSADPRATRRTQETYDYYLPFDSVICHNVYNTAYTAPQSRMRLLRSNFPGGLLVGILEGKDSLWANTDWTKLYEGTALFLRAADRWVRWRYTMEAYRNLLRFGRDHRATLPQMKLPVLVAIGTNDLLYSSGHQAHELVSDLFDKLGRDPAGESLWHLEFNTPPGTNGHQLLVHHSIEMADMADAWIRYRRGGPGSSFQYESGTWRRIR